MSAEPLKVPKTYATAKADENWPGFHKLKLAAFNATKLYYHEIIFKELLQLLSKQMSLKFISQFPELDFFFQHQSTNRRRLCIMLQENIPIL